MSSLHTSPTAQAYAAIAGDHWIETLLDGSHVLVRPLQEEDRERERRFIERLSPTSRHFRFLAEVRGASDALLGQLMSVHEPDSCAFIALVHDNGELREVGISRYSAAGEGSCECAVTVAEDWQHRGLGVALMRHLIAKARAAGFKKIYSIDSSSNSSMRELAAYLGFTRSLDPDDSTQVIHSLAL
jgi:GNAT superfamily N-acetyltransferase